MMKHKKEPPFDQLLRSLSGFKFLVPIILSIVLLIGGTAYYEFTKLQTNQLLKAISIGQEIDDQFITAQQTLLRISNLSSDISQEQLETNLESILENSRTIESIFMIDQSGKVILVSPLGTNLDSFILDYLNRIEVKDTSQTFTTVVLKENENSHIFVTLVTEDERKFAGKLRLTSLDDLLNLQTPGNTESILILDQKGLLITANESSFTKQPNFMTGFQMIKADSFQLVLNQGYVFLESAQKIHNPNWYVIILDPITTIFWPDLPIFLGIMTICTITWAIWNGVIRHEIRFKVADPIKRMNEKVDNLIRGKEVEPCEDLGKPNTIQEIVALYNNINNLFQSIQTGQYLINQHEQKYRALVEQSTDAICLRVNGAYEIVNRRFTELFGITQETVLISDVDFFCKVAPRSRLFVKEKQQELILQTTSSQCYEFTALDKNNQEIDVEVSTSAFPYQGSVAYQAIFRDITERKSTERAEHELRILAEALRDTASTLNSTLDFNEVLDRILNNVGIVVPHDSSHIMLIDKDGDTARILASRGYEKPGLQEWLSRVSFSIRQTPTLNEMYQSRRALSVPDTSHNPRWINLPSSKWIMSFAGAPIKVKDYVIGFLNLNSPRANFFTQEMAERLQAFADQAGIALHNARLLQELQVAYDSTLQGWSKALELRDYETEGHSQRVEELTIKLARRLNIPEAQLTNIRYGVLLHDIGKIGIPDGILFKPGPLSDDEWEKMRKHPEYAYQILAHIPYLSSAIDIPYYHHEKWDGSGYPKGLKGDQIPLGARIFSIVDVWDGLRSKRPYHDGWPQAMVIQYIQEQSGRHFDPDIVRVFLEVIHEIDEDQENDT